MNCRSPRKLANFNSLWHTAAIQSVNDGKKSGTNSMERRKIMCHFFLLADVIYNFIH